MYVLLNKYTNYAIFKRNLFKENLIDFSDYIIFDFDRFFYCRQSFLILYFNHFRLKVLT